MRRLLIVSLLTLCAPTMLDAAQSSGAAVAASPSTTLTPEQARDALQVLDDPHRRAQIEATLRAIAAAGALGTPSVPPRAVPTSGAPTTAFTALSPARTNA